MTTKVGGYVQYGWKIELMKNVFLIIFTYFMYISTLLNLGLHFNYIFIPSLIHL